MASANPMATSYIDPPKPVSKKIYCIAGILTNVYGVEELQRHVDGLVCLWLLHPRLQTQACMESVARSTISAWHDSLRSMRNRGGGYGLIAVSFDQRNHGSREIDKLSNEAWKHGNPKHAQDMFASYHGTAVDTSHLLTYLSSYIFPNSEHTIMDNVVCGVSLGGHAAWHCVLHDPRITAAIVIIGCPDYINLMTDRARLSKLATWTQSSPPGSTFLGSKDFPPALIEAVKTYDPAGFFLGTGAYRYNTRSPDTGLWKAGNTNGLSNERSTLRGKRILNLSGGADKLVPYKCSEPFLHWLKESTASQGLSSEDGENLQNIVFDGVGHEMTTDMVKEVERFMVETLQRSSSKALSNGSKI